MGIIRTVSGETGKTSAATENYLVGIKGLGLKALPRNWAPPFFIVTVEAYSEFLSIGISNKLRDELSDRLLEFAVNTNELIVRSSASNESLRDRGQFESVRCPASLEDVVQGVKRVWEDFARKSKPPHERMALLIQAYVAPAAVGHLSNERRISRRERDWLCEIEQPLTHTVEHTGFNVRRLKAPENLTCGNVTDLEQRIQQVAACHVRRNLRYHFEWIWDGDRLWVVQRDTEKAIRGIRPGSKWISPSRARRKISLRLIRHYKEAIQEWPKIRCVRTFESCGLPVANLYVLEDINEIRALAKEFVSAGLTADLEELAVLPFVIRTDVIGSRMGLTFDLPRTDCLKSAAQAAEFLKSTSKRLTEANLAPDKFCFVFHHYIPAMAAAQSIAWPKKPKVRIDSSWGLPDGLQFYPHDSFEVDSSSGEIVASKIRSKSEYLDADGAGNWIERIAGVPWDWKQSLTRSQLSLIASQTAKIADHLGEAVDVMYFVGVPSSSGHPACIPWIYTQEDIPSSSKSTPDSHFSGQRYFVTCPDDLQSLAGKRRGGIRLRPTPKFCRNALFLTSVGQFASERGFPIELEGSILSHGFYVLSKSGAHVRIVDPFRPARRRQQFGKLVRDLIPVRIATRGERAKVAKVSPDRLLHLLKAKAVEESLELFSSNAPESVLEELADIYEVVRAICALYDRPLTEIISIADEKQKKRGGFQQGIYLIETEELPVLDAGNDVDSLFSDSTKFEENGLIEIADPGIGGIDATGIRIVKNKLTIPLVPTLVQSTKALCMAIGAVQVVAHVSYEPKAVIINFLRPEPLRQRVRGSQLSLFD